MAEITKIIANFDTQLAQTLTVGAITGTLRFPVKDDDGVVIPNGRYIMCADLGETAEEHLSFQLNATTGAMTDIMSVSKQGAETAGCARQHRTGAKMSLTNFANLLVLSKLINGDMQIPHTRPITYAAQPVYANNGDLVTLKKLNDTAIAGAPNASEVLQGLNEIAAVAEIDTETDTGATGAQTVITPKRFADSKYGPLVRAQATPNMTVAVKAFGIAELTYAGGNTSTIIAPVTNPRIDLVVLTSAGALAVRAGTEAVTPIAPTPTDGDTPLASILLQTSTTTIPNTLISNRVPEKYVVTFVPTQLYKTWVAGQALTIGDALVLNYFVQPLGRILNDNKTFNSYNNQTNGTIAFTVGVNTNRILIVTIHSRATPSSVTYNGVAMTLVDNQSNGTDILSVFKLVAPATGTNNVIITCANIYASIFNSYYNVDQATNIEAVNKKNSGNSTDTVAVTSLSQCAVMFGALMGVGLSGTQTNSMSFGGYAAFNKTDNTSSAVLGAIETGDSGYVGNTQSVTGSYTFSGSGGGTPSFNAIQFSIKPANPVASPRVVKSSASNAADLNNLVLTNLLGFARATVAAEANVDVVYGGITSGLAGLTQNTHYFLSNTAGLIATSAGTNSKKVGLAVSATELLVKNENI